MVGYFRDEAATASALDADGWLHTGDIGSMDALGYCRVHSRLCDMIIRGGENIYPREVEDVLFAHSAIANVAVFGLPDSEWGEVVAACIQLLKDRNATAPELDAFCRDRLASYKKPSFYYFADTFPETASGKIQKFTLRDRVLREKSST
jgi:fatty-acyl-CoA synthase